jgi:hypothetical protein
MRIALLIAAAVACCDAELELPPGMKLVARRPRVALDTMNSLNRLLPPKPASWPANFSVSFVTNSSWAEAGAGEGKGWSFGASAVKSTLFFEAGRRQRIYHGAGARECVRFYNTSDACSLVFREHEGMYALTEGESRCCLDIPDIGTPRRDWPVTATHSFVATKRINGRMCHGFQYAAAATNQAGVFFSQGSGVVGGHVYWQDSETKLPCAFDFVGDERLSWFFDVESLHKGPQDDKLFQLPATCEKQCAGRPAARDTGAAGNGPKKFENLVEEVVGLVEAGQTVKALD